MRLHRLRITAFGPFAGTEEVDLDSLGAAGLFLLYGATGAGKTSILDAVCFALFGGVPGARLGGDHLRSQHAAAGVRPEVMCELSVGSRRLRVTRSPEWQRPKKRGAGTTREPASTLLQEWAGSAWRPVTNRNDEAARELDALIGMGLEQFTRVVLLPQGEFATFLRASAEDRRPLLQRLFGAGVYTDVEGWLAGRRRDLSGDVLATDQRLAQLLARAVEAAAPIRAELPDPPPAQATHAEQLADWVGRAARRAAERSGAAADARLQARQARTDAAAELDSGRELARKQLEHATALAEVERAKSLAPQWEQDTLKLASARAASPVAVAADVLDDATTRRQDAVAALELARQATPEQDRDVREGTAAEVSARSAQLHAELARVNLAVDKQHGLAQHRAAEAALAGELAAAQARADETARHVQQAVDITAQATAAAQELAPEAGVAATARHAVEAGEQRLAAAERAEQSSFQVESLTDRLRGAVDEAQEAHEAYLDIRERRLAGMAAELATTLVAAQPCPVCGATEHPRPAATPPGAVDQGLEEAARARWEASATARGERETELAAARERHAAALGASGGLSVLEAQDALADARRVAQSAEDAAARLAECEQAASRAKEATESLRAQAARQAEQLTELVGRHAAAAERATRAASEIAEIGAPEEDLAGHQTLLQARTAHLELLAERVAELARAEATHREARRRAERAASAAGFSSLAAARAAVLDADQLAALETQVGENAQRVAAARERLADPVLCTASATPPPDVPALESALAAAEVQSDDLTAHAGLLAQAAASLAELAAEARAVADAAHSTVQRYQLVEEVSRCAEGTGGGNTRRMRLSSYVLAARLEQVAEAASVRLAAMSGGRYTLVHSDELVRGQRSGLGLRVVDAWTGLARETGSLSGGESFFASLALALGLADVVQAEAGGTPIETLFVDEGFGSLDEETLEEVMTVLDSLRDGGRAVGVVSHVADLRSRIPAQLEVVKGRDGSHVRQRGAA